MMWMNFIENRMSALAIVCIFLSIIVPITIYWLNNKYHASVDPGWKKERSKQEKQKKNQEGKI